MNKDVKTCERCSGDFCTSPCYFDRQPNEFSVFRVVDPVPAPPPPPMDRVRQEGFTPNRPPSPPVKDDSTISITIPHGVLLTIYGVLCVIAGYLLAYQIHMI